MPKTCETCRNFTPDLSIDDRAGTCGLPFVNFSSPPWEDFGCTLHKPLKIKREWRVTRLEGQEATRELRELCKHLRRQAKATSSGMDYRVRLTPDGIALEISEPPQGPLPCEDDQLAAIDAEITESARLVHRRKREPKPETELGRRLTALRSNLE
jgi:hypothetical protein